ncbi:hypothetical protein SAMN03159437_01830 [Pseudomonas sp. NFACC25]|nr:hypothetical protein FX984_04805 [Pseudomonas marginalis]SCX19575.1 hypothetical protein SAMN03159437_01830 [Pseudomonas sp. NFACC25]
MQATGWNKRSAGDSAHICLASAQRDQSLVAGIGDADNSLSMRRVKSGSCGCMNQACGGGGGWHCTATGRFGGVEKD